ncbi:hypothetical protein CAPTEDRAFT_149014 [Capitella teleta]|uniref:Uncharacterized protein n=1 Tax=Capitella teleta TaxID=283909 RepID=R7VAU7_CAPTE|nr:hypothetical protein CAPTEDRAFT_149014 [Capitella teleta]|eukprot:ELU15652.1 hypothetical protein CAPTEDRAFT_149014 [Capitella teleta]
MHHLALNWSRAHVYAIHPFYFSDLCTTKACVTVASSILNSMDSTVDPCEDFYAFACNGWMKAHPIPSGSSRWGTFGVMWKDNQIVLMNAVDNVQSTDVTDAEVKAKLYFTSCMDPNKTIAELGAKPLLDLLKTFGGWNIVSDPKWEASEWDFQTALERGHSMGLSTFFNMWVGEDEKTLEKTNILQFDQSGLGLARDQFINKTIEEDKVLKGYLQYMTSVGVLLGGEYNHTKVQMQAVIDFEQRLAEITTPMEERRDEEKLYHKISLSELQNISPFVQWVPYINSLLDMVGYRVNASEKVLVYAPDYLTRVSSLVAEMLETEETQAVLNNYMVWHLVRTTISYLPKEFLEAKKEFLRIVTGVTGEEEHWRYCITDTDTVLGFALGAMFVREAFNGDRKDKAEDMIQQIKTAFKANLPKLEWMDEDTRNAAVDKADAVVNMIGFPPYILNSTALNEKYSKLNVSANEYFDNNIRCIRFGLEKNLEKLREKPDNNSWSMTPPTVNAYYTPVKNQIVFPAGILQAPFYDRDYPKSLNFGGMGVVMGHELTHGFDDQGREYDKHGILRPWWNERSIREFKKRAKCMAEQYSTYSLNGDNVRGNQTLGENIADNGGLKAAYNAYNAWVKENGEEVPLPGVDLTHRQLFFMGFAQVWCSNSMPEADHMSILADSHSPSIFRVIGPLSNSREFAEQFQCRPGSRMNPVEKCEVW